MERAIVNYEPIHDPYSPWPNGFRLFGKAFYYPLAVRRYNCARINTTYGDEPVKAWKVEYGRWWFFTFNVRWLHGYAGNKPINLRDPKFYVPFWFDRNEQAVERSFRFGVGRVS